MDSFLSKISKYEFVNFFVSGGLLVVLLKKYLNINLLTEPAVLNCLIVYLSGMISSRIGSVIIEPIYMKIKLIEYAPQAEYMKAEKRDSKINDLLILNNFFRTCIGVCLIVLLVLIYQKSEAIFLFIRNNSEIIIPVLVILFLFVLFSASYKKQTDYIRERVDSVNKSEDIDKKNKINEEKE